MGDILNWFFSTVWPWLFVVLDLVVAVVASGHAVLTKKDSRAALGWVGIIWLTPILGALLYFTFGVNRIQRKARRLRSGVGLLDSSAGRGPVDENVLHQVLGDDNLHLVPLVKYVARLTNLPLLDGNRLTPL